MPIKGGGNFLSNSICLPSPPAGDGRVRGRKQREESFLLNLQQKLDVFAFKKTQ
jgi:hypothetical protein